MKQFPLLFRKAETHLCIAKAVIMFLVLLFFVLCSGAFIAFLKEECGKAGASISWLGNEDTFPSFSRTTLQIWAIKLL